MLAHPLYTPQLRSMRDLVLSALSSSSYEEGLEARKLIDDYVAENLPAASGAEGSPYTVTLTYAQWRTIIRALSTSAPGETKAAPEERCEWCDPSFGCFDGSQPCSKQPAVEHLLAAATAFYCSSAANGGDRCKQQCSGCYGSTAPASPSPVATPRTDALQEFTEYFVANYPGPHTIIHDPKWHAPKIFRAAERALAQREWIPPATLRVFKTCEKHKDVTSWTVHPTDYAIPAKEVCPVCEEIAYNESHEQL